MNELPDTDNLLGIWRQPYTSSVPPFSISGHTYRQDGSRSLTEFLNETFAALATFYGSNPPQGSACLTLLPWKSGGVLQDPVEVCQGEDRSVDDFLARAKRTFNDALSDHRPNTP